MPNEQQIIQMIQTEISKAGSNARFNVQGIPQHVHNNIDAPLVYQPILTYIGLVGLNGEVGILPTGWTVIYNGTGNYSIVHNLNSFLYSVIAFPVGVSAVGLATTDNNIAEFTWTDGSAVDTPFYFILTQVNNKKVTLPTYQSTSYTQRGILA
jgi:hypothetical protein